MTNLLLTVDYCPQLATRELPQLAQRFLMLLEMVPGNYAVQNEREMEGGIERESESTTGYLSIYVSVNFGNDF